MVGKLIVIEGIDGTGKSTQAKLLAEALRNMGYETDLSKEPTTNMFGQMIRAKLTTGFKNPLEETMLFTLDRLYDTNYIRTRLSDEANVVLDRYYFSSMAYQGAKGIDSEQIREINEWFAPKPDLLIILDADPATTVKRINRERDTFENVEYLNKVRKIFLGEAGKPNTVVINANQPKDDVRRDIMRHVRQILPDKRQTTLDRYMRAEYSVNGVKWQVPLDIYIDPETATTLNEIRKKMGHPPLPETPGAKAVAEQAKLTDYTVKQRTLAEFSDRKPMEYAVKVSADTSDLNSKLEASTQKVRALDDAIRDLNKTIDDKKMGASIKVKVVKTLDGPASADELNRLARESHEVAMRDRYVAACEMAYSRNQHLDDDHHGKAFRVGQWCVDRDGELFFMPNSRGINN